MPQLLIDGHNLIGQMPNLSLADFDDEEKLVVALRKYAARRRARIVVVFDSGSPGGRSRGLSGGGVEAIFAADGHTSADRVLIERIREAKRAQEWTLVSSDRAIQQEAARRRMRTVEAAEFAHVLTPLEAPKEPSKPDLGDKPDAEDDVAGWLERFRTK